MSYDKVTRSQRRFKNDTVVARQCSIWKHYNESDVKVPGKLRKVNAVNCGNPRCVFCSNPRRIWKQLTMAEQRIVHAFKNGIEESQLPVD